MKCPSLFSIGFVLLLFASCSTHNNSGIGLSEFKKKFQDFSIPAEDIYPASNDQLIRGNANWKEDSCDLYMKLSYNFELVNDSSFFFIQNNLTQFKNKDDTKLGWDLGGTIFWTGFLKKKFFRVKDFTIFKNSRINAIGDYSEYSELPIGDYLIIVLHVRLNDLIIHYAYLVRPEQKEDLLKQVFSRIKNIKNNT
ncbi:MAG: hypothetical protein FD123_823 [Bacteroidetes bacterium]|nr:MAG: hypothetical protein FD123_823 [Bacteroidota bacterium]